MAKSWKQLITHVECFLKQNVMVRKLIKRIKLSAMFPYYLYIEKVKKKKKVETTIFKIDDKELCLLLRQNFCNLMSQYKHPQIHVFFNKKEYSSNALNLWKEAWILLISIYQLSKLMRFVFLRISKCLGK